MSENLPLGPHTQSKNLTRKSAAAFGSESHHRFSEIEIMKKDILDKDIQIAQYNKQIDNLAYISRELWKLLMDLEEASTSQFLSPEQHQESSIPTPHESVAILKKAINQIIILHQELPIRFEKDFSTKATKISKETDDKRREVEAVRAQRYQTQKEIKQLKRIAYIQTSEKDSLGKYCEELIEQKDANDRTQEMECNNIKEQIKQIRDNISELKQIAQAKDQKNQKVHKLANQTISKRVIDTIKEDADIELEIVELQTRMERETTEHDVTKEELEHTRNEIERGKKILEKFKKSLGQEQKDAADRINNALKQKITEQRDKYQRAIKNQKKRNNELEHQKADLIEEEKMLSNFLQSVEKQLQAQMQKLPSLAMLQHRLDPPKPTKNPAMVSKSRKRAPDDAEMRSIKKAMSKLQSRRMLAKSVIVQNKYK